MKQISVLMLAISISLASFSQTLKQPSGLPWYWEYRDPANANAPVIVFLHGSGECSSTPNLSVVSRNGLPKLIASKGYLPGFTVVVPQRTSTNWGWIADPNDPSIIKLLKYIRKNYPGDGRLFLTGLSMGGNGSWDASYNPFGNDSLITAFVSVSGGGGYQQSKVTAQRKTPAWEIHGDADTVVPLNNAQNAVGGMNSANANPKPILTVIKGGGHNAAVWDLAYSLTPRAELGNTTIYDWFLKQGKSVVVPVPVMPMDSVKVIFLNTKGDSIIQVFKSGRKVSTLVH